MSCDYEESKPVDRLDLGGHRSRKKQQESSFTDWRTSSRIADTDEIFKAVVKTEKLRHEQQAQTQVKQGGITTRLTEQQINQRIARMNIIHQAVKAGTYNDPSQPWNKMSRWIEDGNGDPQQ